jgi:hypothetical protein
VITETLIFTTVSGLMAVVNDREQAGWNVRQIVQLTQENVIIAVFERDWHMASDSE